MLLYGILNPRQRSKAVILTTGKEERDLTESPCRLNRKRYRERKFFGELSPFPTKGEYTSPEGVPAQLESRLNLLSCASVMRQHGKHASLIFKRATVRRKRSDFMKSVIDLSGPRFSARTFLFSCLRRVSICLSYSNTHLLCSFTQYPGEIRCKVQLLQINCTCLLLHYQGKYFGIIQNNNCSLLTCTLQKV